ncbi:MAG: Lar family restriction alleviation protein [Oscillospiraceae bacterium]|nr:Lar family restriction alleviation protein [Oscillospiraceae bacterium]
MNELKCCPFCGYSAEIVKGSLFFSVGYCIKCDSCGSVFPLKTAGMYMQYKGERNVFVTDRMAADDVISKWNNRVSK